MIMLSELASNNIKSENFFKFISDSILFSAKWIGR